METNGGGWREPNRKTGRRADVEGIESRLLFLEGYRRDRSGLADSPRGGGRFPKHFTGGGRK